MSSFLSRDGGRHDIDVELDSGTVERLPNGHMQHHAFAPHLWRKGHSVDVTTTDRRHYTGTVLDVSNRTGNVLIQLDIMPRKPLRRQHVA